MSNKLISSIYEITEKFEDPVSKKPLDQKIQILILFAKKVMQTLQ